MEPRAVIGFPWPGSGDGEGGGGGGVVGGAVEAGRGAGHCLLRGEEGADVCDDQPARSRRAGGVAGVLGRVVDLFASVGGPVAVGLAQEDVASFGQARQGRAWGRVTGVDEGSVLGFDARGEGRHAVRHRPAGQRERVDLRPVPVAQFLDGESGFDRAAGGGVGEEVRQPVGDAGRAVQGNRCGELDVGVERAVVGGDEVRAVVGVQMRGLSMREYGVAEPRTVKSRSSLVIRAI